MSVFGVNERLVVLRPEVMLAHTGQVTGALQGETRAIPIVAMI